MSKRIHVQELGNAEYKTVFIEFEITQMTTIDFVVQQFKDAGYRVIWGASN